MAKREYVEANKRWLEIYKSKCIYIVLFVFSLVSCTLQNKNARTMSNEMLLGDWELVEGDKQVNYPNIEFLVDSTAVLYSQADTLYRFTYFIRADSLYLIDINGGKYIHRIKELTDKIVIFDGIAGVNKEQKYKR